MFATSVLIIVGLSLVSMCISVVQLKLERLFEDMMIRLLEEGELDVATPADLPSGVFQVCVQLWPLFLGFIVFFVFFISIAFTNFLNEKRKKIGVGLISDSG